MQHPNLSSPESSRVGADHTPEATTQNRQLRPPSVTIDKPLQEVYAFVANPENLPLFMKGLERIEVLSPKKSSWHFEKSSWDLEIDHESPNQHLAWKCVQEGEAPYRLEMSFEAAPANRGTVVRMKVEGEREKGRLAGLAAYFRDHDSKSAAYVNLRRLKAYLESGEVPTILGQASGRSDIDLH